MERVLDTLRALRAPDGCPWDRAQTHASLRPHLLEEAAEAVDALATERDADVILELGDVLMQVAFHAVIAEEDGRWSYEQVQDGLVAKLIRRHPHVFGDERADDPAAVERTWARVKAEERAARAAADDGPAHERPEDRVPRALPALARAAAAAKAADLPEPHGALERAAESDAPDDLADALLALAIRARRAGHDPELLLRDRIDAALRDAPERGEP